MRSHSPFFQSLTSKGCASSAGSVVLDRRQHDVAFDAEMTYGKFREAARDGLVGLPVAAGFPDGIHRRRQRMDEGMHVGSVEVVLLVPGRGRQHDVGVKAARRHSEVERDNEIELSLGRRIAPRHLFASAAETSIETVIGAEKVEDGRHEHFAVGKRDGARNVAHQHVAALIILREMFVRLAAEIGESDRQHFVAPIDQA